MPTKDATTTAAAPLKTVEEWRDLKRTPDWLFAAAKAIGPWGLGRELDEASYDAEVARAATLKINPA